MTLPLKIYYTLKEASLFLNEQLNRTDIDESYFLQLGIKGAIRLGISVKQDQKDDSAGSIYSDYFEFDESKLVEYVVALKSCISAINSTGAILILNASDIKDIYFNIHNGLRDAYFDNIYSLDRQIFCIPDEIQNDFYCFKYADKINFFEYVEPVHYSRKHNAIHYLFENEKTLMSLPKIEKNDDDWRSGFWFNREFNYNDVKDKDLYSDRKINKEDCLILGEDIELLLSGKQRQSIENCPPKRKDKTSQTDLDFKMHPKRESSINKIVLALASKAQLDLSNHITAYEKLKNHCDNSGMDLPNKDTCGNLFKAANELKKAN